MLRPPPPPPADDAAPEPGPAPVPRADPVAPTAAGGTGRPGFLPALDGLRAVAVAAVLAYHLDRLPGGFLGVDVFFVVSGFLITRLLLAEHERLGRVALGAFWLRRFRRLVPAVLVLLPAVAVAARVWWPAWRLADLRGDALGALAYVANWRFVLSGQSYFAEGVGPSPLRHTWSLAIEEQFYVLWPLVVIAVLALARGRVSGRRAVAVVAAAGVLLSAAWMVVAVARGHDLARIYYGTDTRAFALLAGAWLSTGWDAFTSGAPTRTARRRRVVRLSRAATVALVPLAVLFVVGADDDASFYRFGFQAVALASAVVIAGVATGEGPVAAVLGSRPLGWIGRRSYGIYLWSWPVQVFAAERFELVGWRLDLAVVSVTVALAAASFRLIEEPVRTGARIGGRRRADHLFGVDAGRRLPAGARAGAAVAVVAVVVVGVSVGAPARPAFLDTTDAEVTAAALRVEEPQVSVAGASVVAPLDPAAAGPFDPAAPLVVDPSASADPLAVTGNPLRVMVAGDSVAWSLAWDLDADLTRAVDVSERALIGCGVMPVEGRWRVDADHVHPYRDECAHQAEAEALGITDRPDAAVLWLGAWEVYDQIVDGREVAVGSARYGELLEARLQARVDQYRAGGVPTIMPVVPCYGPPAARLGTQRLDDDRRAWVNARIRAVAHRNRGWVRLVDPDSVLCTPEGEPRPTNDGGLELRPDGTHLTHQSATWFWNTWLAGQVAAAFTSAAAP